MIRMYDMIFYPWLIFLIIFSFIFALLIFWLWALVDCLSTKMDASEKILWVIVILLFNFIGALLYLIFFKVRKVRIVKPKKLKTKKLVLDKNNAMIAGVCAGIGDYLEIDPTVVRLLWVLFTFFSFGTGILAYIIAWVIIPKKE